MIVCPNPKCGSEQKDDALFCNKCGTMLVRICPKCSTKVEPNAFFCSHCGCSLRPPATGTPYLGGVTISDNGFVGELNYQKNGGVSVSGEPVKLNRNRIKKTAGIQDSGSRVSVGGQAFVGDLNYHENINISSLHIEQNDTTECQYCGCGKTIAVSEAKTCDKCNGSFCSQHFHDTLNYCTTCIETEYRNRFRNLRNNEDGLKILSPGDFQTLEELRKLYDIHPLKAKEIQKEVISGENYSQAEKSFENLQQWIYDDGTLENAIEIIDRFRERKPFETVYVSEHLYVALTLASEDNGNSSAARVAEEILDFAFKEGNESLGIYLALIDHVLNSYPRPLPDGISQKLKSVFGRNMPSGRLAFAEYLLKKAGEFWPDSFQLKCRRILCLKMLFDSYRQSKDLQQARNELNSLVSDSASAELTKMERSWLARVRMALGKEIDPTPEYCDRNQLYFFVLNPWSSESYRKKADSILSGNETTPSPYDQKRYFQLLEIAATKFSSPSSEILSMYADCLANGFGTVQDTKAALEFYRKAAEADGIIILIEGTVLKSYQDRGTHTEYAVPNGITKIANGAFAESKLTKITIPLSVSRVEEDFSPACAVVFVGDRPVEAASFKIDGCVFSVPEIVGIRTVLHSFSRKVRDAEDRVSWCSPTITPNCDRKCESCLLCSGKGIAAQKILAFLSFAMKFCEDHEIRIALPDTPKYTDAAFSLAEEYAHGERGKTQDVSKVAAWYREAAEGGHAKAQFLFAGCCFDGVGMREDKAEAVKWYSKAAEQGFVEAQLKLAGCCFDGIGMREDKAEAFRQYLKVIESIPGTDVQSMYRIGECFFHGWGTKQDYSEAVEWYRKAAEQGLGAAQFKLAACFFNGFGMKLDRVKAFEWYRKADENGITDARAQMILGEGYFNGWNMDSGDYEKALLAYRRATADEGNCFFADYTPILLLKHISEIAAKCPEKNIKNTMAEILRDVFAKPENCSKLDNNSWVSLLTLTDGIPLGLCNWESFSGKNWVDLLCSKPKYAEFCGLTMDSPKTYWTRIIDDQLKALADKQPEFRYVHDLRNGRNVAGYLRDNPEAFKFCKMSRVSQHGWIELLKDADLTRHLVKSVPGILSRYCPWDSFDDETRLDLLSVNSDCACHCKKGLSAEGWGRILKNADLTRRLVKSDPEFLTNCPWDDFTGTLWSNLLSISPEYECYYKRPPMSRYAFLERNHAVLPVREPYEISKDGWLRILKSDAAKRYLSAPGSPNATEKDAGRKGFDALLASCPWDFFAWEDWGPLLSARPEYVRFFKWEQFKEEDFSPLKSIGDLLLAYVDVNQLPIVAIGKMGWGKMCRNWDKLTHTEWCEILKEYPELGKFCNWDLLDGRDWADLLSARPIPMFKDKCRWDKFNKDDWGTLLNKQPDMISFFPCDLHAILNYPGYYFRRGNTLSSARDCYKRNAICRALARKFSFLAVCACMLAFAIISLWGDAGWLALFSESWKRALAAGAIWFVATALCAILHARIWGDFLLPRWLNLGHAFFVSFSFFTIYHWSFFFSSYSFCLILCGSLSFLLFVLPVVGSYFDYEMKYLSFFLIPFFSVFSWFLLSPVGWSTWLISLVILLFIVLCVLGWLFADRNGNRSLVEMDRITLYGIAVWLIPSLIIGVWFLLMPVNSQGCYKIADSLHISFPSASQALYRKGQIADPDFSQMERMIPVKQKNYKP